MQKKFSKRASTCKELVDVNSMLRKINSIKLKNQSSMEIIQLMNNQESCLALIDIQNQVKPKSDKDVFLNVNHEFKNSLITSHAECLRKYLEKHQKAIELSEEEDIFITQVQTSMENSAEDDFEYNMKLIRLSRLTVFLKESYDQCNYFTLEYSQYVLKCLDLIKNIECIFKETAYQARLNFIQKLLKEELLLKHTKISVRPFIALDLDEAIIHTENLSCKKPDSPDYDLEIKELDIGIWKRPYLYSFLEFCHINFDLYLFTAGTKGYIESVVKSLGIEKFFLFILDRRFCIKAGNIFVKDLSIFAEYYDDGILIDNNLLSFSVNLDRGFLISPFISNSSDEELKDAEEFLSEMLEESLQEGRSLKELNENHFMLQKIYSKYLNSEKSL